MYLEDQGFLWETFSIPLPFLKASSSCPPFYSLQSETPVLKLWECTEYIYLLLLYLALSCFNSRTNGHLPRCNTQASVLTWWCGWGRQMHALGCAGWPQEGNDHLQEGRGTACPVVCELVCTGLLNLYPHKFLLILFSWQKLLWVSPHSWDPGVICFHE